MDPSAFGENATGELYNDEGYYSFRPDQLPPDLVISGELAEKLAEASRAVGNLSGIGYTVQNPRMLLRPFIRKEAVQSSQIEGTKATISDLYVHEAGQSRILSEPQRGDVTEVANYVDATQQGITALEDSNISLELIKSLHRTLLTGVRGQKKNPGEFRDTQNAIGAHNPRDARYVPPPPHAVSPLMRDLESFIQNGADMNTLVEIGIVHYQFETIHPFLDGNGRMGRLIITLMLYERSLLPQPFLYLSSYFNRNRDEYINRLFSVSADGQWEEWLEFFLDAVKEQAEEAFSRSRALLELQEEYRKRYQSDRSETLLGLVYQLFDNPIVTASQVEEKLRVTNPTANKAINRLSNDGILYERTGQQRYRVFEAREVLDVIEKPVSEITNGNTVQLNQGKDDEGARQSGLNEFDR